MTMTAATTWVNARTSLVPVVVDPASAGGTSETAVSTTAVTVNVCAGRFAQRVMATAIKIPTAVQISVATAKPRTGMGSAVSAPKPACFHRNVADAGDGGDELRRDGGGDAGEGADAQQ